MNNIEFSLSNNIIMKISRKAGVQSLSSHCYNIIKDIIDNKLLEILKVSISINTTKIIINKDLTNALLILDYNITK